MTAEPRDKLAFPIWDDLHKSMASRLTNGRRFCMSEDMAGNKLLENRILPPYK